MAPIIHYFPIRGRAEVARLLLAYKGVEWQEDKESLADETDARGGMKTNRLGKFVFRQSPSYQDDETLPPLSPQVAALPQSGAILRHLARQHGLYGDGSLRQAADVDVVLEGIESLRTAYISLIYVSQLKDEAKEEYYAKHCDASTVDGARNNGAHWGYVDTYIAASGKDGWAVGSQATVADFALYEMFELNVRIFGDRIKGEWPALAAHHAKIAAIPEIKAYMSSPRCFAQVNNNGLG